MRTCLSSALLGVSATLLTLVLFWPGAAPTAHAQNDGVLQLDRDWNNVAYSGDPLPTEAALNDALDITTTVWVWRSRVKTWDSWTKGAPALLNSLRTLDRGVVVWLRTSRAGPWTHLGTVPGAGVAGRNTLADVLARGHVVVGVKDSQPGFGNLEPDGTFSGQDVEFGHALAAALFGDANAIEFVVASAGDRFGLLARGEIDVLIRTTTWTSSRDIDLQAQFVVTTFYDGQGFLVRADSPFQSVADLQDTTICVTGGSPTETNLAARLAELGVDHTALSLDGGPEILAAFTAGLCDAWTADKGNLAGQRANYPADAGGPDSVRILPDTLSREPLGPVVRQGDIAWFDVVQWVVFGTMIADELGVTSSNVSAMSANPPSQAVANLLGVSFNGAPVVAFGTSLGLGATFMQDVISQVGNYDEIYARTLAPVGLPRAGSLNELWTRGGLIYAPPIK